MQIKFTRLEWRKVKYANEQLEFQLDSDILKKLDIVFSFPQNAHVYLSYDEFKSIVSLIPRGISGI